MNRNAVIFKRTSRRLFHSGAANTVPVTLSWSVLTDSTGHDPHDRFSTPQTTTTNSEEVTALRHTPSPERSSFLNNAGIQSGDIILDWHPDLLPFDPSDETIISIEFAIDGRNYVAETTGGKPTFTPDSSIGGVITLYTTHLRLKGARGK